MHVKKRITAVLLAATTAALAACSSSGSSANSGTGSSGGSLPGGEIVLGSISSCSGQLGSQAAACPATNAWVSSVNAAGGINGHKVRMILLDDQGNPATALKDAKQLVTQDRVQAIVGEQSIVDSTWASYVSASGVPVIGGIPISSQFMSNPDFFANGSSTVTVLYGAMSLAAQAGKKNFGIMYCAESTTCAQAVPLVKGLAQLLGMKVAYAAKISATAASYTSQCLAAKSAGVDSVLVASGSPVVLRVVATCQQQGVSLLNVTDDGTLTQAWLGAPGTDGSLAAEDVFPFVDNSTPATQAFQTAMATYAPSLSANKQLGPNAAYAWTAGKLYEAAAAKGMLTPKSTPTDVKNALYLLQNETLGGLVPPLTFVKGKPTFVSCYFEMGVSGATFTAPKGLTPQCIPPAQLAPLLKSLGG